MGVCRGVEGRLSVYFSFSRSIFPCLLGQFSSYRGPNSVFVFLWRLLWWRRSSPTWTSCRLLQGLFNGLRRFPYIYLTSVSLMIPCFDPIQAPHAPLCIYSFPSQFFPLLAIVATPTPLLILQHMLLPYCPFQFHVQHMYHFLMWIVSSWRTHYLAGNTVGLHWWMEGV